MRSNEALEFLKNEIAFRLLSWFYFMWLNAHDIIPRNLEFVNIHSARLKFSLILHTFLEILEINSKTQKMTGDLYVFKSCFLWVSSGYLGTIFSNKWICTFKITLIVVFKVIL